MPRKTVLIVEDDQDIRQNLRELLEGEGYHVKLAAHGKEALDILSASSELPGLVLLDLMMPVMDGRTFLLQIGSDPKFDALPVIVISAAADPIKNKIVGFMKKPVDIDQVLAAAQKYCVTP